MAAPPTASEAAERLRRLVAEAFDAVTFANAVAAAASPRDASRAFELAAAAGAAYAAACTAAAKAEDRAVPHPPPPLAAPLAARTVSERPTLAPLNDSRAVRVVVPRPPLGVSRPNPRFAETRRWSTIPLREARANTIDDLLSHERPVFDDEVTRFESTFVVVIPDRCRISEDGGTSKHKLLNLCDRTLAFKIHTSDNSNYSVDVTHGFIDVLEKHEFNITRKAGKSQPDELLVFFCYATGPDALAHFDGEDKGKIVGQMAIKLTAAK